MRREGDLLADLKDERHQFQNQVVLKEKYLDQRVRRALSLAPILLDKEEIIVTELA